MPIIDCRYRPSTQETMNSVIQNPVYAEYIIRTNFAARPVKSLPACLEELRGLGIVRAVVAGRDCESTFACPPSNDYVLACMEAAPDMFTGFYGFDPHKGMRAWRGMKEAFEKGMRGASIEPCMAKCCVSDAKYYPLYALCCDFDIPVSITAGLSPLMPGVVLEHMDPRYIDRVARDFPDLRLLISHGGYPWVNEAVGVCMRHKHVYLDFSTCEHKLFGEFYVKAANEYITDKVVFSSANPFVPVDRAVETYAALELTPEARRKLLHDNAVRFLSVEA